MFPKKEIFFGYKREPFFFSKFLRCKINQNDNWVGIPIIGLFIVLSYPDMLVEYLPYLCVLSAFPILMISLLELCNLVIVQYQLPKLILSSLIE